MSDINRTAGDTRRVIVRLAHNSKAVPLTGWANFKMLVDPSEAPASPDTRVMLSEGVVIDAAAGRVGFVQTGAVPPGKYFYQMRGTDPNGEVVTFKKGRYLVDAALPG
jgi:hypothetical protein